MGCWNATCGVSHLPILCGDKVATTALVIEDIRSDYLGGGFSYTFEMANPMSLFFFGEYNDYGGVELELSDIDKKIYADLANAINADGALANNVPEADPEFFFNELVERSETSFEGRPVCIYHVRRDVFDRLVSFVKTQPYNSYRGPETIEEVFKTELRSMIDRDPERLPLRNGPVGYIMGYFKAYGVFLRFIENINARKDTVYTEYVIDKMVYLFAFNTALSQLRMHWSPQSGAGSQDSDVDIHAELIDVMADEIDRIKNKWNEDYEDE